MKNFTIQTPVEVISDFLSMPGNVNITLSEAGFHRIAQAAELARQTGGVTEIRLSGFDDDIIWPELDDEELGTILGVECTELRLQFGPVTGNLVSVTAVALDECSDTQVRSGELLNDTFKGNLELIKPVAA